MAAAGTTYTFIYLEYRGIELLDDHCLSDYDIIDGMSILHQAYKMPSYSAIDYEDVARKVEESHKWVRGDAWKSFPVVITHPPVEPYWASVPVSQDTTLMKAKTPLKTDVDQQVFHRPRMFRHLYG